MRRTRSCPLPVLGCAVRLLATGGVAVTPARYRKSCEVRCIQLKPYAIICYGHKQEQPVPIDCVSTVEIRPAWGSRHSHQAHIFLNDGNVVTFAAGSHEFCEQCKAEMEAMLKQGRTFYWHYRMQEELEETDEDGK